jgi:hypothetical protein
MPSTVNDLVLPANATEVTSFVTGTPEQIAWCLRTEQPRDTATLTLWHTASTLVTAVDPRQREDALDRLIGDVAFSSVLLIGDPRVPVTSDLACAPRTIRQAHGILWDRTGSGEEIGPWLHLRRRGGRFCIAPALAVLGLAGLDLVDRRNAIQLFMGVVRLSRSLAIAPVLVATLAELQDPEWQELHRSADVAHLAWRPFPA